ncbi:MAG: thiamine pyrophosphate-binding protein [Anaerolineales bacterium]|jgi:acetolactate synthase-1/2/3 large subunit
MVTTCSDYLAEALVASGIPYVAGIPGHGNLVFQDTILKREGRISWILVRHEQSAVHFADGYFRATGKPLAVATSVGPGAFNTMIGIATAYADSSAVVLITGTPPTYLFDRGCLQEVERQNWSDFPSVVRPIVKRSWQVTLPEQLPGVVAQLVKIATTGRPGPVHVDFPMDVQAAYLEAEVPDPSKRIVAQRMHPEARAIEKAAEMLVNAERPVLLAGGGVIHANAHQELKQLAEHLGVPVINSLHGKGSLPDDHPLAGFTCGSKGTTCANNLARNADVILATGTRFGEWTTSTWDPDSTFNIPPTRLIHLDIDDRELCKNYPTEVALWGDAKAGLAEIFEIVKTLVPNRDWRDSAWVKQLGIWRAEWREKLAARAAEGPEITTTRALKELRAAMSRDTIVTGAAGHAQGQMFQEWETFEPRTHLSSAHFSTMGFAFPAAMGAKLAKPEKPVVAIMGDGDFQMSIHEMATAVQYKIPIIGVVFNNGGLLSVRDLQISALESHRFGGTEFRNLQDGTPSNPDFMKLADAYGFKFERVLKPEEIGPALNRLTEENAPGLLEIVTASTFPQSDGIRVSYFDMPVPRE